MKILGDMTLMSNEAWAAINSIAVAVTAIMAWLANRKRASDSAANSAAIAAVHEVAKSDTPTTAAVANAEKAVAAIAKDAVSGEKKG